MVHLQVTEISQEIPRLVRDLMTVGVETCSPDAKISDIAQTFLVKDIDDLVVLSSGNAIGVIGREDLLRAFTRDDYEFLTASDILRYGVPQVPPDIPIRAAAQIMLDQGIQTLFLMHHAAGIEYPAACISLYHLLRFIAARGESDLKDLGIHAERRSPLEIFVERREAARRSASRVK